MNLMKAIMKYIYHIEGGDINKHVSRLSMNLKTNTRRER